MATLCEHCGQTLPRDDTQFCNHCGQFVKPSTARPASAKPTSNGAASWSASREQASTPPAEKNEGRANVPPWLSKLDKEIEGERIAISSPQARNPIRAARATSSPQAENPAKAATALKSAESMRELRVKVWEDQDGISEPEEPSRESTRREVQEKSGKGEPAADGEVDALPTAPLNTTSIADLPTMSPVQAIRRPKPERHARREPVDADPDLPTRPLVASPSQTLHFPPGLGYPQQVDEDIEQLETRPVQRQRPVSPARPASSVVAQPEPSVDTKAPRQPVIQQPITPPVPVSPTYQSTSQKQAGAIAHANDADTTATPVRQKKSKKPLVVMAISLAVLLVGGMIYWMIAFQPFSVPAITRTSVSYHNSALGVALQYPQGWSLQQNAGSASFFDANHTDQVTLLSTATAGQSIDQYIKQEEARLGLTSPKQQPALSFAGAGWQQVQGNVVINGVTETEGLLVTTHNGRFYALIQMAPAPTYHDADTQFFALVRSSLQFV